MFPFFIPLPVVPSPPPVVVVVTNEETGKPVPGCLVSERIGEHYETLGRTDANGELKFYFREPGSVMIQRNGFRVGGATRVGRKLEGKIKPIPPGFS